MRIHENGKIVRQGRRCETTLTGMLFCGRCHGRLASWASHGQSYYRCRGHKDYLKPCKLPSVPALSNSRRDWPPWNRWRHGFGAWVRTPPRPRSD
ncbi:MAG: recombinase zinc beta ribbon domain-containing protein [Firmicutes bacterium]|nr:recombinase zinc beta ribbon domain-containing protein [Bacillota bacterium]